MGSFDFDIAALVLGSAFLHAFWNALVKRSPDRILTMAVMIATGTVVAAVAALFVAPPEPASWPYIAGTAVIHHGYYAGLIYGYRHGDLGQFYPIARGTGPLLVALASWLVLGEHLGTAGAVGVAAICTGVLVLGRTTLPSRGSRRAVVLALVTGVIIASYTLCDGVGVRLSGNRLGYIVWGNICSGLPFMVFALVVTRDRVGRFIREDGWRAAAGGLIALVAYAIAVWAMSVTGLAYVAALRETSVVIAAIIGATWLGEPFGRVRVAAAALVAAGIVVLSALA